MHILYLAQRVPYPPNRGDRICTYHEIRLLARRHQVHVAALAENAAEAAGARELRQLCASVDVALLPRWRSAMQSALLAATPLPLTLPFYFSPELAARVAWLVASKQIDLIHVFSSSMAQYVDWCSHLPRVMEFADLDSIKWRQMSGMNVWPKSWVYAAEAVRLLWYERSIVRRFDRCCVVTEEERQEMLRFIPFAADKTEVVANGVDLNYFKPLPERPLAEPDHLVFVGVMDYFPNEEGMLFFCREVLPLVRRRRPACRLTIVGARPTPQVEALGSLECVTVTGAVDDVRPFMQRAALAVVPLRLARGVQNKVLEAMAMGLPVVASSAAFRGINATAGHHALVADEPPLLADAVVSLLQSQDRRRRMGQRARQLMTERYSWEAQVAKLESMYEELRQLNRPD